MGNTDDFQMSLYTHAKNRFPIMETEVEWLHSSAADAQQQIYQMLGLP